MQMCLSTLCVAAIQEDLSSISSAVCAAERGGTILAQ